MRITLNKTKVITIPDEPPTPKVIIHEGIAYLFEFDNNYKPVPHYKTKSGNLVNSNGSLVPWREK